MVVGSKGRGAALLLLAAGMSAGAAPALAQQQSPPPADPAELDPSAPLDPMPDIGVDWPDLKAPDNGTIAAPGTAPIAPATDLSVLRRYDVAISGIQALDDNEALRKAFDAQSVLVDGKGKPVNAAQIDRRARADSDLLAELLRADGYYDAEVEPEIDTAGAQVAVTLAATPGERYRFAGVDLPGLGEAESQSDQLRAAFAVKAGDPVIADKVIAAGLALKVELGRLGFATADIGEQDIVIDHEAKEARLVLPVSPGPVAKFGQISVTGSPPVSA